MKKERKGSSSSKCSNKFLFHWHYSFDIFQFLKWTTKEHHPSTSSYFNCGTVCKCIQHGIFTLMNLFGSQRRSSKKLRHIICGRLKKYLRNEFLFIQKWKKVFFFIVLNARMDGNQVSIREFVLLLRGDVYQSIIKIKESWKNEWNMKSETHNVNSIPMPSHIEYKLSI